MTAHLAVTLRLSSGNARAVINKETVKPIPAITPTDNKCIPDIPLGSSAIFMKDATLANKYMPSGLPIKRPVKTPAYTGDVTRFRK